MAVAEDGRGRTERAMQTFVTGIIGILPLTLSLAVLAWLINLLHDLAGPSSMCGRFMRSVGLSVVACDVVAYVIGLIGVLLAIYGLGVLVEKGIGRRWSRTVDDAMQHVPVLGTVYDASKQVTSIFNRKQDSRPSMTPVICYLGEGRGVGTPALMPTPELVRLEGNDYHVVMIPTAPVPFGGALVFVKAEWVKPANCGFDELVGVYMSMGVTAPRSLGRDAPGEAGAADRAPTPLAPA